METSLITRIPWFHLHIDTIYIEYPNREKTFFEMVKNVFSGETNMWSEDKYCQESEDEGITEERVEEMVKARLENYHKQIMKELKKFHVDLIDEVGAKVDVQFRTAVDK